MDLIVLSNFNNNLTPDKFYDEIKCSHINTI